MKGEKSRELTGLDGFVHWFKHNNDEYSTNIYQDTKGSEAQNED